jgi:serralysin
MFTLSELALLRAVDNNATLPGIDTKTGNQDNPSTLMQLSQFSILSSAPYNYDPATNIVRILRNGVVLNDVNFGSATVMIEANNVTLQNCTFTATTGWYSVDQDSNYSGAVIKNCTFNSLAETDLRLAAFVTSRNAITIENNSFLDAPGDAVDIGAGIVSGNYFSGAGYDATHPDAIWVTASTGPTLITNNFIDWTMNATSTYPVNNCIRITTEGGSASNITVTGNYLIGGSSVIDAGNSGSAGTFSNINISNNYIGFGICHDYYPGPQTGVTETGNVIFDFSNPIYSTTAWAAYQASGIVTNALVTATAGVTSISANATGTTTLYGNGEGIYLFGGASETIFIGGAGIQAEWGGSGKNIFSYLSIGDSTALASDYIGNFNVATDVIDLHAINANPASSSPVNFNFIGGAAFSSAGDEICVVYAGNETDVQVDMAGGSSADMVIRLGGIVNLTAANFALTTAQYNADIAASNAAYTTMASFLGSKALLDQVAGGFSIVDSLANVQANLAALQADAGHINAVTLTSGAMSVNAATFAADQAILDKIGGGFAVVDTGANVQARMGALAPDAAHIASVTLSNSTAAAPAVLTLSTAAATADAAILAKIASPYVLDAVGSSGTTVTGHGAGLTIGIGGAAGLVTHTQAKNTITGGGAGDTFYFSANFGVAEITDFGKYASASTLGAAGGNFVPTQLSHSSSASGSPSASVPDAISLSTRDFANWSTLLADGRQIGANTVFTAADGASLTLDGVSLTSLQNASAALKAEFKFHA